MIVTMPDPHPGRCLNHRQGADHYGYPLMKRCLDYENHTGPCTFPEDPKRMDSWTAQQGNYTPAKAVPWISPLDSETTAGPKRETAGA